MKKLLIISMILCVSYACVLHVQAEDSTSHYEYIDSNNEIYEEQLRILSHLEIVFDGEEILKNDETYITRREAFIFACRARGGISIYTADTIYNYGLQFLNYRFSDIGTIEALDDYNLLLQCTDYELIIGKPNYDVCDTRTRAALDDFMTVGEMERLFLRINYVPNDIIEAKCQDESKFTDFRFVKKKEFLAELYDVIHKPYYRFDEVTQERFYIVDELIDRMNFKHKESSEKSNVNLNLTSDEAKAIAAAIVSSRYGVECNMTASIYFSGYDEYYRIEAIPKQNDGQKNSIVIIIDPKTGQIVDIKYSK